MAEETGSPETLSIQGQEASRSGDATWLYLVAGAAAAIGMAFFKDRRNAQPADADRGRAPRVIPSPARTGRTRATHT
jgi:hypothetical protein